MTESEFRELFEPLKLERKRLQDHSKASKLAERDAEMVFIEAMKTTTKAGFEYQALCAEIGDLKHTYNAQKGLRVPVEDWKYSQAFYRAARRIYNDAEFKAICDMAEGLR